jgi:hypothetical protein
MPEIEILPIGIPRRSYHCLATEVTLAPMIPDLLVLKGFIQFI